MTFGADLLAAVCGGSDPGAVASLRHVTEVPARTATTAHWPDWAHPDVLAALAERGITQPWTHQVLAADLARGGHDVVVSTGTASGKSLAFQLPVLDALLRDGRARALYLSPTKALGHDQLRAAHALTASIPGLIPEFGQASHSHSH